MRQQWNNHISQYQTGESKQFFHKLHHSSGAYTFSWQSVSRCDSGLSGRTTVWVALICFLLQQFASSYVNSTINYKKKYAKPIMLTSVHKSIAFHFWQRWTSTDKLMRQPKKTYHHHLPINFYSLHLQWHRLQGK